MPYITYLTFLTLLLEQIFVCQCKLLRPNHDLSIDNNFCISYLTHNSRGYFVNEPLDLTSIYRGQSSKTAVLLCASTRISLGVLFILITLHNLATAAFTSAIKVFNICSCKLVFYASFVLSPPV